MSKSFFGKAGRTALVAMVAGWALTGCTSTVNDAGRTPVGGVISGKTDSASDYLKDVEQQNQQKQQSVFQSPSLSGQYQ